MPDWGFEIHCKRWVEGLDAVLYSLRDGCCYRTPFGRYGDITAESLQTIEAMARAVSSYCSADPRRHAAGQSDLCDPRRTERRQDQACQCFVEVTQSYVVHQGPSESFMAAGWKWRNQADNNPLLKLIFSGEGLDRGLCDGGGYWVENRLLTILRLIGGQQTDVKDILGSCNFQLRHVFRDDRQRMEVTRGLSYRYRCVSARRYG